jgi:uncharacterized membrane protein YphA (DoxX/SURF4 family)
MSAVRSVRSAVTGDGVSQWLPVGLRVVAAAILMPAGLLKFVDFGPQATRFAAFGIPAAEVMVVFVGVLEVVTALALAFGAASRVAGLVVVPIMLATFPLVGAVPSNVAVLLASLGVVALGPGRYALWDPESELLGRLW